MLLVTFFNTEHEHQTLEKNENLPNTIARYLHHDLPRKINKTKGMLVLNLHVRTSIN